MMKKNIMRISFIIIALLWMGVIFYFSNQTGSSSAKTSSRVTEFIIHLFIPNYEKLPVAEQKDIFKNVGFVIRKLGHYTEYGVLGLFLFVAIYAFTKNQKIIFPFASILGILYAISDEFHQSFVSGRAPMVKDVIIDSIGLLTVLFFIGILLNLKGIRRKKGQV